MRGVVVADCQRFRLIEADSALAEFVQNARRKWGELQPLAHGDNGLTEAGSDGFRGHAVLETS
ncbi:hypothetical protein CDO25_11240 [Sinorhizobium meliloti]|nr:hypothetical protein CDO25_11240 [Sinorhizobium meliloti]